MSKKLIFAFVILFSIQSFSQRYRDYEIGPMLNYEHTSLYVSNDIFNGSDSEGYSNSGFEPNYAAGLYFIYYLWPKAGLGAELYFQRTTSTELPAGEYYNTITFMPYVNFDPFRQISGFNFGAGIGAAFIQELPDYGAVVKEEDIRVITIPLKLSISYRIRNQFTTELGAKAELLEAVAGQVRRNSIYLGIKVPLNRVFGYYR